MRRAVSLVVLAWLFAAPLPAQAAPAPIVFDFEDGLQGWELSGSAQRVQTQVLGGEWAIFGDGLLARPGMKTNGITLEPDLTEIVMISVDQFLLLDSGISAVLVATVRRTDGVISGGSFLPGVPAEPGANPGTWTFDASDLVGLHEIAVLWNAGLGLPKVAFLDNITFHPVPEPSSWLYLSLGIAGVVMIRRKLTSQA